jgi:hypothetical protein
VKATFEFQLPEDRDDYDTYRKAVKYALAIEDFSDHLRNVLKYENGMDDLPAAKKNIMLKVYEVVQREWYDVLKNNEVNE